MPYHPAGRLPRAADKEPVLPPPLEHQLESIVEDVLGDQPLAEPQAALLNPADDDQRIVVTGIGLISPLGNSVAAFWEAIASGQSGVGYNELVPNYRDYPCHIAAIVRDFDAARYMDAKEARRMSRMVQFGVAAGRLALEDAGLRVDEALADEIGVVLGCGSTALPETEQTLRQMLAKGGARVSPFYVTGALPNMPACQISIQLGLRGYNSTIATACAASAQAIGEAAEVLRRGDARVVLAGGAEAPICELTLAAFSAMRALSTYNDDPPRASRPFDATRNGFVPAEGAAVLVLETLSHARARNARIYAELIGYGVSSDAFHVTAPDPVGSGAARAMARALRRAGIAPQQVDYINAHATSTPAGDAAETLAIKSVFGEYAYSVPISSTKSMIGHLTGAAGAIEAVATIMALKHGLIPPTINYQVPDPQCDLDYVPNQARPAPLQIALSNSFGFGGQNASLVFRRYDERPLSPGELAIESEFEHRLDEQ
ncbi:beta-ketoacyl-ACP synthase II [Kallotenue papyrolyticum]|uniref:beta-ketoacyl-ACP synthase II n=1 Tax=Kallotenue papyrolyticum TaxID=1325125 RepID=UPI0004928CA7|nr:beta-ketoacyl-ACP synthase II [Kallotenue papyrolyticum]